MRERGKRVSQNLIWRLTPKREQKTTQNREIKFGEVFFRNLAKIKVHYIMRILGKTKALFTQKKNSFTPTEIFPVLSFHNNYIPDAVMLDNSVIQSSSFHRMCGVAI